MEIKEWTIEKVKKIKDNFDRIENIIFVILFICFIISITFIVLDVSGKFKNPYVLLSFLPYHLHYS